jgi:hypothetical protein
MKSLEMNGEDDDGNIVNVDVVNKDDDDSCSVTCVEGDGLTEMDSDEVRVSERENSDLDEPPQKKMKSIEMNGEDGNVVSGVDVVNNDNDGCREISFFPALSSLGFPKPQSLFTRNHTLYSLREERERERERNCNM